MSSGMRVSTVVSLLVWQMSCRSTDATITMTGEEATIGFHDGSEQTVEILAIEDSTILCLADGESAAGKASAAPGSVKEFSAASISRITVSGFRNNNWWIGVVGFQVLPAAGLAAAAASVDAEAGAVFAVAMVPAFLTTLFYASSGLPTPEFGHPITDADLVELRKYARFGGRLTPAQKEGLLRAYGQGSVP